MTTPIRPCSGLHPLSPDTCKTCWFAVNGTEAQKAAVARAAGAKEKAPGTVEGKLRKVKYTKRDGTTVTLMWDGVTPLEKLADDERAAVVDAGPCRFVGKVLTGPEKSRLGLGTARRWTYCLHEDKPLGDVVCGCRGCGPACRGYAADPDRTWDDVG